MTTPSIFPKEKENPIPIDDISVHGSSDSSIDHNKDIVPPTYETAEQENTYDNAAFTKDNGDVHVNVEEEDAAL